MAALPPRVLVQPGVSEQIVIGSEEQRVDRAVWPGDDARTSILIDFPIDVCAADLHLRLPALPRNFLVPVVILVVQIPVFDGDALGAGGGQDIGRNTRDQIARLHRCPQSTKRPKMRN